MISHFFLLFCSVIRISKQVFIIFITVIIIFLAYCQSDGSKYYMRTKRVRYNNDLQPHNYVHWGKYICCMFSACVSSAEIGSCNDCWNPPLECVTCADRWWWKDLNTCLSELLIKHVSFN